MAVSDALSGWAIAQKALGILERLEWYAAQMLQISVESRPALLDGAVPYAYTVGTQGIVGKTGFSSPNAVDANANRRGMRWTNSSAPGGPTITLGLGSQSPSAGAGIVLQPGETWNGLLGDFVWKGSVTPVASLAGALLTGVEA